MTPAVDLDALFANLRSWDSETWRFRAGLLAPPMVCASTAWVDGGQIRRELLVGRASARDRLRQYLEERRKIAVAFGAYDLAVAAQEDPSLLPLIFAALDRGDVHDVLISEGLDAIAGGHFGYEADGRELRNSKGEVLDRYNLDIVTRLNLGRVDAKARAEFKESYALFEGFPAQSWPPDAQEYPLDDAVNTLEDAIAQIVGRPGQHEWVQVAAYPAPGAPMVVLCAHCGQPPQPGVDPNNPPICPRAPRKPPHRNHENLQAQVDADFCLRLGAAHSFRTDPEKVEKLAAEAEEKHKVAVTRFQKKGWIREDGTGNDAAFKRAVATAYGAAGACKRCGGGCECLKCGGKGSSVDGFCKSCGGVGSHVGKVRKYKIVDCRGVKERGRYQGCTISQTGWCGICGGAQKLKVYDGEATCKNVFSDDGAMTEAGCDGTGLDLSSVPLLPRTDKLGVKTDRDTAMESGDDDVSDYGENEFEKTRSTYVPYLRTGVNGPLWIKPNVIVASCRCSYEDCPVHQFPRQGGERGCVRARGRWCGYPIEMVLGSTDYSAGELCTLSQYTYWLFGYSRMLEAINASGDPGILHSELAAEVLSMSLKEFLERLKAGDKQMALFRQSMKPISFGKPAAMGAPKITLTSRKKNAGFTVCENGPAVNRKGEPGYWGIRFCITIGGRKSCGDVGNKIMEWKKRPTPPVCKNCCDVIEHELTPAYFRRFPEMKDYHKWGIKLAEDHQPAPSVMWDEQAQRPRIVRVRGGCDLSALLNNGFQSMLADIGKYAYCEVTRECYLGIKRDGSPSPLYGCRVPLFLHDEPLSELILKTAHLSGPRIGEVMESAGKKFAPDVKAWTAKTALAFWWSKEMEPVYEDAIGPDGQPFKKLVPWGPRPDYLEGRMAA